MSETPYDCDVFIAGSGPIGCAFARTILEHDAKQHGDNAKLTVWMAEIGSQDNPVIGAHHKNSVKYQKDIDAFVHVIQGALQPISVPPQDSHMSTLGGIAWTRPFIPQDQLKPGEKKRVDLVQSYHNPKQDPEANLIGSAVTRTVGGMATHWTCACPRPHEEERSKVPFDNKSFDKLLDRSHHMLGVNHNEFNNSIRHTLVRDTLDKAFPNSGVTNLPLAVKRNEDNPEFVTWSGSDTVLGTYATDKRFTLFKETRVTKFIPDDTDPKTIKFAEVRDLKAPRKTRDRRIHAKYYVAACGAVSTPQLLFNSHMDIPALGRNLTEQSIAFCQIVLKQSLVDSIATDDRFKDKFDQHKQKYKEDPLRIPYNDPEPQVTIPYDVGHEWHTQIHRDAFSYGDVGPRADPRVIVDLRFFGRQDINPNNRVEFASQITPLKDGQVAGTQVTQDAATLEEPNIEIKDLYGMPQATFHVTRSKEDDERDHRMMLEMCNVASHLGAYLPGSYPQFMEPGLALHITGTTRLGKTKNDSVADENSKIHDYKNIFVGGNGCIPDSTACNPTLTSVCYAIKSGDYIYTELGGTITPEEAKPIKAAVHTYTPLAPESI